MTLDRVRISLATMTAYGERFGVDVAKADLEHATIAWLVVDAVLSALGIVSFGIGRLTAADRIRAHAPELPVDLTLDAASERAEQIADAAFVERVADLARQVH